MNTQIAHTPIQYKPKSSIPQVSDQSDVSLQIPRYIVTMGDHITPADKRILSGIGGWAGGFYLGHEKFPTSWRTEYMALMGAITPLEKRAVVASADMEVSQEMRRNRVQINDNIIPDSFYEVYPGEDVSLLTGDDYKDFGFVEVEALRGKDFEQQESIYLQLHFFPQWLDWMEGKGQMPVLLSEREALIRDGLNRATNEEQRSTGFALLESCRLFREYAQAIINTNREYVRKGANDGGYVVGWQKTTMLYAEQLGIDLEPETAVRDSKQDNSANDAKFNALLEQNNKLLEALAQQQGGKIEVKEADNNEKVEVTPSQLADAPTVEVAETKCSGVTANGTTCKNKADESGLCHTHR